MAGRFTFDLWGFGQSQHSYRDAAQALRRAFLYGLTDSIVIWHNWQRWGYDYRLPEIYPPNPQWGRSRISWSWSRRARTTVCCSRRTTTTSISIPTRKIFPMTHHVQPGRTTRAGLREPLWDGSPSYRLRADRAHHFIARNLGLIRAVSRRPLTSWTFGPPIRPPNSSMPTAIILTGFTTARRCARLRLHPRLPGKRRAGDLGGRPRPVDRLVGWRTDSAFGRRRLRPWRRLVWHIKCADAERVPWFDMAHHDRFILQGAGYPERYTGGPDPKRHGNYSDDYIATEVLDGHPAMVSDAFSRDVVRKYWLLHDLMRALALRRMEGFEFDGGESASPACQLGRRRGGLCESRRGGLDGWPATLCRSTVSTRGCQERKG